MKKKKKNPDRTANPGGKKKWEEAASGKKKKKSCTVTDVGPPNSVKNSEWWKLSDEGKQMWKIEWWVMSDELWVISDEWWVMEIEWRKLSDQILLAKQALSVHALGLRRQLAARTLIFPKIIPKRSIFKRELSNCL